ncbi:hypothetical protein [Bacillus cereus]|uniref:hypothetical protein n=1 Tax=Bacillus cereus TaxID=1396 RepID=UPI0018F6BC26|nr:hypothetical protein [Bacillus cereus]
MSRYNEFLKRAEKYTPVKNENSGLNPYQQAEPQKQRTISPRQAESEQKGIYRLAENDIPNIPYECEWYFERIDEVFGTIYIDGKEYTTFHPGQVTISNEHNIPVIRFNIIGHINRPREISTIETSNNLEKNDIIRYCVNRSQEDLDYFQKWLDDQLYGGKFQDPAQHFVELLDQIDMFNRLLNAGIIKYSVGRYILARR